MELPQDDFTMPGDDFDPLDFLHDLQYGGNLAADYMVGNLDEFAVIHDNQQLDCPVHDILVLPDGPATPESADDGASHFQEYSNSSQGSSVWGGIATNTEFDAPDFGFTVHLRLSDTPLLADIGSGDCYDDLQLNLGQELEDMILEIPPTPSVGDTQIPESPCLDAANTTFKPFSNFNDAVIVALGICGLATGQEIYNVIKAHSLNSNICAKTYAQFIGPLSNVINSDRVHYRRGHPNLPKDENARMFDSRGAILPSGRVSKRMWLTPLGRSTARTLVGLPVDATVSKHCISFSAAIQCILTENLIVTCDDIVRIFREEKYCTFLRYWSHPNTNDSDPGSLDESRLRGLLSQYLVSHIGNSDEDCAAAVSTANNYYWLTKNGYDSLFEKLNSLNPYPELGMTCFKQLIISRIKSRMSINISEDKLNRKTGDAYDTRLDCVPMIIPASCEHLFFDVRESSISGAGKGLWLKDGIDLPVDVFIEVLGKMRRADPNSNAWGSHVFGTEDPASGDFYAIDALQSSGDVYCLAARMNDSRDLAQQFSVTETVTMPDGSFSTYLRSTRKIHGGEEVFYHYGDDYWAGFDAAPGPVASDERNNCKKRQSTESSSPEPCSKRQKDMMMFDIPAPLYAGTNYPVDLEEF